MKLLVCAQDKGFRVVCVFWRMKGGLDLGQLNHVENA